MLERGRRQDHHDAAARRQLRRRRLQSGDDGSVQLVQGNGTLTIVKEKSPTSFEVEQNLKTMSGARTLTFDSKTNHVLLIGAEYVPRLRRPPRRRRAAAAPRARWCPARSQSWWSASSDHSDFRYSTRSFISRVGHAQVERLVVVLDDGEQGRIPAVMVVAALRRAPTDP